MSEQAQKTSAKPKKISTSHWKAWINMMPGPHKPNRGIPLHVIGTVDTHNTDLAYLESRVPQGINPKILMLDLHVVTGIVPVHNPQQVHYTQYIKSKDTYNLIEIYYEGNRVAEIDHIEIVQ
jgi:hypothetical protein